MCNRIISVSIIISISSVVLCCVHTHFILLNMPGTNLCVVYIYYEWICCRRGIYKQIPYIFLCERIFRTSHGKLICFSFARLLRHIIFYILYFCFLVFVNIHTRERCDVMKGKLMVDKFKIQESRRNARAMYAEPCVIFCFLHLWQNALFTWKYWMFVYFCVIFSEFNQQNDFVFICLGIHLRCDCGNAK